MDHILLKMLLLKHLVVLTYPSDHKGGCMLYAGIVLAVQHVLQYVPTNTFMCKIHRQLKEQHGDVLEECMFTLEDQQLEMARHPH